MRSETSRRVTRIHFGVCPSISPWWPIPLYHVYIPTFVCHLDAKQSVPYLKYFRPATSRNFSMKSSESRTAMCAARPIRAFAVAGNAWCTSYLTRLTPELDITGYRMLWTISRYAAPGTRILSQCNCLFNMRFIYSYIRTSINWSQNS